MQKYNWTPDQVQTLTPLWRQRLLLVESYRAQIDNEQKRKAKSGIGAKGSRR